MPQNTPTIPTQEVVQPVEVADERRNRLGPADDEQEIAANPNYPATPSKIQTGMKLSEEALSKLETETIDRIVELMDESGLQNDRTLKVNSFMGRRNRYQESYDGNYDWRGGLGGVFSKSNFSKGTNKRYVRKAASKMRDDLLGSTPFFGILPVRPNQPTSANNRSRMAHQIEKYIQNEVERSNVRSTLRLAQRIALIRNEAVVKVTYISDVRPFYSEAEVLVEQAGMPVLTATGQYIFKDDDFFADQNTEGLFRLEKEPTFEMIEGQYQFAKIPDLKQYQTLYKNVDCRVVDFRSFLCPLTAASIHEADTVVQLMDLPYDQVKEIYGGIDTFDIYASRIPATDPVSGEQTPKESHGEEDQLRNSRVVATVPLAEVYRRVDADGDGEAEEIFMVIDLQKKKLIFWDYLYRHMGKRPFEVVPGIEAVPNRWYSVGIFQTMEDHQLYIDGQFNRVNIADSKSDTLRFRVRNSVKQWKDGSPVVCGTDDFFDCEAGFDQETPPAFQVNFAQPSEMGMTLMRDMEQAGDLMWGSISAQDASASDLNQSKTATGILNLERVGDTLIKDAEIDQSFALTAIMEQVIEVLLENLDPMVSMYNEEEDQIVSLNSQEIRDLEKEIRLVITRSRSTEQFAVNEKAEGICLRYFQLTPMQQYYLRDFYIYQLKSLEVPDADDKLPRVSKDQADAWVKAQQENTGGDINETANLASIYTASPDDIKRQIEGKLGFKPSTMPTPEPEDSKTDTD